MGVGRRDGQLQKEERISARVENAHAGTTRQMVHYPRRGGMAEGVRVWRVESGACYGTRSPLAGITPII